MVENEKTNTPSFSKLIGKISDRLNDIKRKLLSRDYDPWYPLLFDRLPTRRFGAILKHVGYSVGVWEHPDGYAVTLVKHDPEICKAGCRGVYREIVASASEAFLLFNTIKSNPHAFDD